MTFILRSLCQDGSRVCHHLSRPGHLYTRGAEFGVMLILVSGASVSTSQLVINNICCYDSTHVETAASSSWARQLEADSLLLSSSNISIPISQSLPTDKRPAIQRKSAKRKWRNSFVRVGKVLVLNFPSCLAWSLMMRGWVRILYGRAHLHPDPDTSHRIYNISATDNWVCHRLNCTIETKPDTTLKFS